MIVGSFGNITFRTSSFDVTTFKNLARKRTYSFSEHEVVSGKPYLQAGHEGLETLTFDIVLDKALNPLPKDCRECRDMLDEMLKTGDAFPFVLGTSYIGDYVIENIAEKDNLILGNMIVRMDLAVSLKEYH